MSSDDKRIHNKTDLELTLNGSKIQDSPWHRENVLESPQTPLQTVSNLDGIATIQLPRNWFKAENHNSFGDSINFRPSAKDTTRISLFADRKPLNEPSQEVFNQVTSLNLTVPRILFSQATPENYKDNLNSVKILGAVLGSTTVGDNQVSFPNATQPAFHLESLKVERLNGKNVLVVDGWFSQLDESGETKKDANGLVKSRYQGVIFGLDETSGEALKVRKLSFQSDDELSFNSNKAVFRKALKSITWK